MDVYVVQVLSTAEVEPDIVDDLRALSITKISTRPKLLSAGRFWPATSKRSWHSLKKHDLIAASEA